MRRRVVGITAAALLLAACTGVPGTSPDGQAQLGGQAAAQLCDPQNPAGLTIFIQRAEEFRETGQQGPLEAMLAGVLALLQQLELEAGSDASRWQVASVDAIEQLQRRIGDPERAPEVARHAIRTLGILQDQICP